MDALVKQSFIWPDDPYRIESYYVSIKPYFSGAEGVVVSFCCRGVSCCFIERQVDMLPALMLTIIHLGLSPGAAN